MTEGVHNASPRFFILLKDFLHTFRLFYISMRIITFEPLLDSVLQRSAIMGNIQGFLAIGLLKFISSESHLPGRDVGRSIDNTVRTVLAMVEETYPFVDLKAFAEIMVESQE